MAAVIWLPEAQDDLRRLYEFIEPHSPKAPAQAVKTLVAGTETLRDFLQKGRPWQPDPAFRELSASFGARGYVIRYREHAGQLVVVRVWHTREER